MRCGTERGPYTCMDSPMHAPSQCTMSSTPCLWQRQPTQPQPLTHHTRASNTTWPSPMIVHDCSVKSGLSNTMRQLLVGADNPACVAFLCLAPTHVSVYPKSGIFHQTTCWLPYISAYHTRAKQGALCTGQINTPRPELGLSSATVKSQVKHLNVYCTSRALAPQCTCLA
jgi:hypothetical protein